MGNLTYDLHKDLDFLDYEGFEPILFHGIFDGHHHTISNLLITKRRKYQGYVVSGIFDVTHQYAVIKDTSFVNVTVSVEVNTDKTYAGIVAGFGSPDMYNILVVNSSIFTRGLSSRFTGTLIGYIPIVKNWCNYTFVRMNNVTVINTTNYFRQLGTSQQHTYGGLVGYSNQRIQIYNSKVVSQVAQNQINQYTVIGGVIGKLGYHSRAVFSNVTSNVQFNTQLLTNGVFGGIIGENEYNKDININNCFIGIYGELIKVPIHVLAWNYSDANTRNVVIQYEVNTNLTTLPQTLNVSRIPSVYIYSNISGDETKQYENMTVVTFDERTNTNFYSHLLFKTQPKGIYWQHTPFHHNKLPFLDAPYQCDKEHQSFDGMANACICDEYYKLDIVSNECTVDCPVNEEEEVCSGVGDCMFDIVRGPYCQCHDTNCVLPACECPVCPISCVCGLNNVCDSCQVGYTDLATNCSLCASGYYYDPASLTCNVIREENCTTCNGNCVITHALETTIKCTSCNEGFIGDDCSQASNKSGFNDWWIIGVVLGILLLLTIILLAVFCDKKRKDKKKKNDLLHKGPGSQNTLDTSATRVTKNGPSSPESANQKKLKSNLSDKLQNKRVNSEKSPSIELNENKTQTLTKPKPKPTGDDFQQVTNIRAIPRKRIRVNKNSGLPNISIEDFGSNRVNNNSNAQHNDTKSKKLNQYNNSNDVAQLNQDGAKTKKLNDYNNSNNNQLLDPNNVGTKQLNDYSNSKNNLLLNHNNTSSRKLNDDESKLQTRKIGTSQLDDELLNPKLKISSITSPLKKPVNKCGLDLDFANNADQTVKTEDVANDLKKYKISARGTTTNPLSSNNQSLRNIQNQSSTIITDSYDNEQLNNQQQKKKKHKKEVVEKDDFELVDDDFANITKYSNEYMQSRTNQLNDGKIIKLDRNLKPTVQRKVKLMPIKKGRVDAAQSEGIKI